MVHCSLVYEGKQKILGLELFDNFKMFFFLSFTRLGLSRMAIFQKKEKKKLQCPNSPPLPPTAHCSRPPLLRRTHNTFQIFFLCTSTCFVFGVTASTASSSHTALKNVDQGEALGFGANNMIFASHLEHRKAVFQSLNSDVLRYQVRTGNSSYRIRRC